MAENVDHPVRIDLTEFKLHIHLKDKMALSLHFNSPSRKFYLSLIALVVMEMRKRGKIVPISLEEHLGLLALLNDTVGGSAGSSEKKNLLPRIYRKWKHALPNLEEAPLFKALGRKKEYEGLNGKTYRFTEMEKDLWANLFGYVGSEENVRLKFAIDKLGGTLDDIVIIYGDFRNENAWESFLAGLRGEVEKPEAEPAVPDSEKLWIDQSPRVEERPTPRPNRYGRTAWMAAFLLFLAVITWAIWKAVSKPAPLPVASIEKMAFPLPDEPSIAVLPFVNLSGDKEQEFFSDGITESIITALSKAPHLFVIARNSTFTYKNKPVKVKQVSEELGVRYVLEGSVQKSGDFVRISAQLIDALTGHHLWAERYERNLIDLFALQDDITIKILTATRVKLTEGESASLSEQYYQKHFKGKQGLECYLKIMEAQKYWAGNNIESTRAARRIVEGAMGICSENPEWYIMMGWVFQREYWVGAGKSPRESIEKGIEMAQKALGIDDSIAQAHCLLGHLYALKREYAQSIAEGERSVALDPGGARVLYYYALSLNYAGRYEEAIRIFQKTLRLDPVGSSLLYQFFGAALFHAGRFEESVWAYKKARQRAPDNILAHVGLAMAYIRTGREQEARAEATEVLRINPNFSVDSFIKIPPYRNQSAIDNIADTLRKAGLK